MLQGQATTNADSYADAQQVIETILMVTGLRFPPQMLLGGECIVDFKMPIKTGLKCDIYSLEGEKVIKKVFRIATSEREHVERYARVSRNQICSGFCEMLSFGRRLGPIIPCHST
jgi:serine/threonine-protein kinase RIO1